MIQQYLENIKKMCEFEHYPFEKPLHEIYKKELCISPIPHWLYILLILILFLVCLPMLIGKKLG